jgi:hypothetical protein
MRKVGSLSLILIDFNTKRWNIKNDVSAHTPRLNNNKEIGLAYAYTKMYKPLPSIGHTNYRRCLLGVNHNTSKARQRPLHFCVCVSQTFFNLLSLL